MSGWVIPGTGRTWRLLIFQREPVTGSHRLELIVLLVGTIMKRVSITAHRQGPNRTTISNSVAATLSSSFTKRVLQEVRAWMPILASHGAEDAAWNWSDLMETFMAVQGENLGEYEFHVLRCRRQVQALMILEVAYHTSPITRHPLVYVEHIAVAPWNRSGIQNPRRFSGCGGALLTFAAERSQALGYSGRVGLHSLPGSRGFYASSGLKDSGPDSREGGLHYFEVNA